MTTMPLEPRSENDGGTSVEQSTAGDPGPASAAGPTLGFALGAIIVTLGFLVGARVISDNSFLTHFTTGDLIRVRGSVPTTDPYSYTAAGEPWTVQSWFASLIYSWTNLLVGGAGIRVLNGILTAVVAVVVWVSTDRSPSLLARITASGMAITVGATMWTPRPLLFGLVGIAVVQLALSKRLHPAWLIPMMWIWVNSHGSFPLAGVFVTFTALGAWLDDRKLPRFELTVLAWTTVATALGALNPLGPRLLFFPLELLGNSEALEGVAEWSRPGFDRPVDWIFAAMVIGTILGAVRRVPWRQILPAAIFILAGFQASRNIGVAAIVMAPIVALALESMPSSLRSDDRSFLARGLFAGSMAGLVVSALLTISTGALDLTRFPEDAVDWMEARDLVATPEAEILQPDTVGNYLDYRFGLEARVFIDDRFDFFPPDVLDDHRNLVLFADDEIMTEVLERRRPTAILWEAESEVARWLEESSDWSIGFRDDDWIVAVPS